MTPTVDLELIKTKLIEKLKPSGWATKLRGYVQSSDFDKVLETLYSLREDGKRFTPPLKDVFRAFEECPEKQLKVVIIGQDPYPQLGVADGIAFSCSNTGKIQPSLQKLFEEIKDTVYPDEKVEMDPNLTRWANQGVLLINTALTCQLDKPGSHFNVWQSFLVYLLDILSLTNTGLMFVFMGQKAQEYENLINPDCHHVFRTSHPASAAYNQGKWDCKDVFNKINEILRKTNGESYTIKW